MIIDVELTDEVNNTAGVTPLVVVPGDELDEVGVKGDTGLGVEDGGVVVTVQVRGDNVVLSVGEDTYGLLVTEPDDWEWQGGLPLSSP